MSIQYKNACKAYLDYCNQNNFQYQEPSYTLSDIVDGFYILENTRGELFRWKIV